MVGAVVCNFLGYVGLLITPEVHMCAWFAALKEPPLMPSGDVFVFGWTIAFSMMGIASVRLWRLDTTLAESKSILALNLLQLLMNGIWNSVFGLTRSISVALIHILAIDAVVLLMWIKSRSLENRVFSTCCLLYLVWCIFATNAVYTMWIVNYEQRNVTSQC